jgi:hypothetical protein
MLTQHIGLRLGHVCHVHTLPREVITYLGGEELHKLGVVEPSMKHPELARVTAATRTVVWHPLAHSKRLRI